MDTQYLFRLLRSAPGILYANLGGFSIVFEEIRGWGPVTGNLPFLAMLMGMCAAGLMNIYFNKYYFRLYRENGDRSVPEARLPSMMIGGVLFAIGLFVFACEPCFTNPLFACTSRTNTTRRDIKPQNKLLALDHRHFPDRRGVHSNLPSITKLPRRHFHALQRQRRSGQHVPTSDVRRRVSSLHRAHVSQHWRRLGEHDFRVRGGGSGSRAVLVSQVGAEHQGERRME